MNHLPTIHFLVGISQNGNLPRIGLKIKNLWNHHPVFRFKVFFYLFPLLPIANLQDPSAGSKGSKGASLQFRPNMSVSTTVVVPNSDNLRKGRRKLLPFGLKKTVWTARYNISEGLGWGGESWVIFLGGKVASTIKNISSTQLLCWGFHRSHPYPTMNLLRTKICKVSTSRTSIRMAIQIPPWRGSLV